jgi:hypothetical protein
MEGGNNLWREKMMEMMEWRGVEGRVKMNNVKRLIMPMLLGVLLVASAVGVASARPNARPVEQGWRVLTVTTGGCFPWDDTEDWKHMGTDLRCDTGTCDFVCTFDFPAAGEQAVGAVYVKKLSMYAYDNNGDTDKNAYAYLQKAYPPTGGSANMAIVQTSGASSTDPQIVVDTSILSNPVWRTQGPYLWIEIAATNVKVYGFYIHYTW